MELGLRLGLNKAQRLLCQDPKSVLWDPNIDYWEGGTGSGSTSTKITIAGWFYWSLTGTSQEFLPLLSLDNNQAESITQLFGYDFPSYMINQFAFLWADPQSNDRGQIQFDITKVKGNAWNHILLSLDTDNSTYYALVSNSDGLFQNLTPNEITNFNPNFYYDSINPNGGLSFPAVLSGQDIGSLYGGTAQFGVWIDYAPNITSTSIRDLFIQGDGAASDVQRNILTGALPRPLMYFNAPAHRFNNSSLANGGAGTITGSPTTTTQPGL